MILKSKNKPIAAISMARNDDFFIPKWISYYGNEIGYSNLFLILDGEDQKLPKDHDKINVLRVPHRSMGRAKGDRNRSRMISAFARGLFYRYDRVIAHDIDEFLVLDPKIKLSLFQYLQKDFGRSSISGLGLDIAQHLDLETEIDIKRPFLEQRSYAHVSARYTKPALALQPLTWGSGFHRIKGRNFHIDPNLFLLHFGMIDFNRSKEKTQDSSRLLQGWAGHLDRRLQLYELIKKQKSLDADGFFPQARKRQQLFRPLFAWNKPGTLSEKPVVMLPERFKKINL
ncbi:glycosyltransferase family 2 protein [Cecembia sp.]|uniref:glycosyltransferase family 2 protein n=1 Tax=Cecembia sp. TaxID=1898110 RepID=UPI0025C00418|nr:glycosyltransferase family 2 protein [Cecembia sp.]